MKTKMKKNPIMVMGIVYVAIMLSLVVIFTCCNTAHAQTNLLSKERINLGLGMGPNYLCKDKAWGHSKEVTINWNYKAIGLEFGVGKLKSNTNYGLRNYLKTFSFLRIGPSYSVALYSGELITNVYAGYLEGSVETKENVLAQNMIYGGVSQKVQFPFVSLSKGKINLDFFTKISIDCFPKGVSLNNKEKGDLSLTGIIGLSFKIIPHKTLEL